MISSLQGQDTDLDFNQIVFINANATFDGVIWAKEGLIIQQLYLISMYIITPSERSELGVLVRVW